MNFTKKILQVYASPHSLNAWAYIDTIGWRKIQGLSTDGVTNMFVMCTAAKTSGVAMTGTLSNATATSEITILYY